MKKHLGFDEKLIVGDNNDVFVLTSIYFGNYGDQIFQNNYCVEKHLFTIGKGSIGLYTKSNSRFTIRYVCDLVIQHIEFKIKRRSEIGSLISWKNLCFDYEKRVIVYLNEVYFIPWDLSVELMTKLRDSLL